MTENELEEQINALNLQISELSRERRDAENALAALRTDLKVGDRVTYDGADCVWELTAIKANYDGQPKFIGAKIKKDGTAGANSAEINWRVPYRKSLFKVSGETR